MRELVAGLVLMVGCGIGLSACAGRDDDGPTGSAAEAMLTDNGQGWLSEPIGNCGDSFPVCGGRLLFSYGQVAIDPGWAAGVGKYQVKMWDDYYQGGSPSPVYSSDDVRNLQQMGYWKAGHQYTVGIQACKQGLFNSWNCGQFFWASINAPNFKWANGNDLWYGDFDPNDITRAPGGFDDDKTHLTACHASFMGGLHPGKARAFNGVYGCDFGWGGQEHFQSNPGTNAYPTSDYFEVLESPFTGYGAWTGAAQADWSKVLAGGYEADGSNLYVCRAYYGAGLHPGKVAGGARGTCNIGYGGREIMTPYPYYDVYLAPPIPAE